jgi:hypothetical protein
MAPQLGAPSGEAGFEDGAGDDALPPVSVKVLRNNGVLLPPAHAFLCSVLRNYHDSQS